MKNLTEAMENLRICTDPKTYHQEQLDESLEMIAQNGKADDMAKARVWLKRIIRWTDNKGYNATSSVYRRRLEAFKTM